MRILGKKGKSLVKGLALASLVVTGSALAAEATTPKPIVALHVGTESTYAPFEFTHKGKLVGFDIDLAEALIKQMGRTMEWVPMSFDSLIPALLTGQLDLAVASFTKTPERAKRLAFSDPYYRTGLTLVVRQADLERFSDPQAVQGHQLCAQLGSVSARKAQQLSPQKVTTFSDASGSYMELMAGGCDAVVNDRPVNQYFLKTQGLQHGLVEVDAVMDAEDMAIVVPLGHEDLLADINKALAEIKANGVYQQIYDKWFSAASVKIMSDQQDFMIPEEFLSDDESLTLKVDELIEDHNNSVVLDESKAICCEDEAAAVAETAESPEATTAHVEAGEQPESTPRAESESVQEPPVAVEVATAEQQAG